VTIQLTLLRILTNMADLLRDETSEIDFVGPTLPVLKSLLTPEPTYKVTEFFQRVVHGLLSSCLLNIDEMRSVHVILQYFHSILTRDQRAGRLHHDQQSQEQLPCRGPYPDRHSSFRQGGARGDKPLLLPYRREAIGRTRGRSYSCHRLPR
jgi:hypothetical protein